MKPKVISTIIEDEVVFMTDADIEFVSLVKHGANRTPFKILKSDKGGVDMDKVITAVLIPTDVSDEDTVTLLDGYRSDEVKEYDSYKSYVQVEEDAIDLDTVEVVVLDKDHGVLGVTADLKDASKEKKDTDGKIEPTVVEKDALDYATIDSLYTELYAMADIVGGSMRQSNVEPKARQKTILSAIDNFRSFAEILLKNLKEEDIRAVKAEDHPDLAHTFAEEDGIKEPVPTFDAAAFEGLILGKVDQKLKELTTSMDLDTRIGEILDSLKKTTESVEALTSVTEPIEALGEKVKEVDILTKTVKSLSEDLDKLKTTPKGDKTEKDELETEITKKDADFTGTLFSFRPPKSKEA